MFPTSNSPAYNALASFALSDSQATYDNQAELGLHPSGDHSDIFADETDQKTCEIARQLNFNSVEDDCAKDTPIQERATSRILNFSHDSDIAEVEEHEEEFDGVVDINNDTALIEIDETSEDYSLEIDIEDDSSQEDSLNLSTYSDYSDTVSEPSTPQRRPSTNPLSPSKWTPAKNYSFEVVTLRGKEYIKVLLTPSFKQYKGKPVIYRFKIGDKRYIGATASDVEKRAAGHRSDANQARRGETEYSKIAQALAKNPEKFQFGVIKVSDSIESLDKDETTAIKVQNSVITGFNTNSGGGGGTVQRLNGEKPKKLTQRQIENIEDKLEKNFEDITWRKFFINKKGRIDDKLTKAERKLEDVIYVIACDVFNKKTKKTEEKLYIGYASHLGQRMSTHRHYMNHTEKKRAINQKMYKCINENHKNARVGILPLKGLEKVKATKAQIEKIAIKLFDTKENGFNLRGGGGGGFSKKKVSKK